MSGKDQHRVQIVIVGAGPTGLAAANLLGLYGIETLLLERNPLLSTQPKAVAIDDEGLRICQALGLQAEVFSHIQPNLNVEYRSGNKLIAQITPLDQPNGHPMISTFHQPSLEAILLNGLKRFSCVQVQFGHTLEAFSQTTEEVTLHVRTPAGTVRSLTCAYLLACDGGKSSIRHELSIPLRPISAFPFPFKKSSDATQRWLVVDVEEGSKTEQEKIIFFCNPERPAVTVPTPGHTRRWEFMLFPDEREESLLRPEMLQTLIAQAFSGKITALQSETPPQQVIRQAIYTFHTLIATSFCQGRIFLLGDAAHQMPPFGGQGMNSGLRDAYNLCWKLAYVLQANASTALLQSYEQERALHTSRMIRFSDLLGHVIMPTQKPIAMARDLFFWSINLFPAIRQSLNEMRVKPVASYRGGALRFPEFQQKRALIGTLLPQVQVHTEDGQELLLDELLGHDFSLLRLSEKDGIIRGEICIVRTVLSDTMLSKVQQADVRPERNERWSDEEESRISFAEHKRQLSRVARQSGGSWLLLRPDHFILDILVSQKGGPILPCIQVILKEINRLFSQKEGENHDEQYEPG